MTARHPTQPPAVLAEIIRAKHLEISARKAETSERELRAGIADREPTRGFVSAVVEHPDDAHVAVIAEFKRKSPSAGWIRAEDDEGATPERIAQAYDVAGARAISCLTDEIFFGGHLSFLDRVRSACTLPVLRKDFLIDPWQVLEARAAGADAVLLIAECLDDDAIRSMVDLAAELSLGVLLEIHDEANLDRAQSFAQHDHVLLGINNRDLRRMVTDLDHTIRLLPRIDRPDRLVSESGIQTPRHLTTLKEHGVRSVLIGEHLMRQPDPGEALRSLLATP